MMTVQPPVPTPVPSLPDEGTATERRPTVLFVDDEPHILSALRRMMRSSRGAWDCLFATSGAEALEVIAGRPVDVVVSDMLMPGMNGSALLDRVKALRPQTVRIILSGHSGESTVLKAVGPAHQYLGKPCEAATLEAVITRALTLRAMLQRRDLRQVIGALGCLPSPQDHLHRLLAELDTPTASARSISALIEQDVAMLADILRMTNSQYFGLARHIATAQEAVRILGTETIRALAYQVGLFRVFRGDPDMAGLMFSIGQRGLEAAAHCRVIAHRRGLPQEMIDQAACAGMLWEAGLLALIDCWPDRLRAVLGRVVDGAPLGPAVRAAFNASHGEIGGYLLGLWGFNDQIVEALVYLDTGTPPPAPTASLQPILRDAARLVETPLAG